MIPAIDQAPDLMSATPPLADARRSAHHRRTNVGYCLTLVLLPLIAIPACIALGGSDFFLHHGASVWVQANDKVFDTRDRDCDVVVYGDSTAMTGIDPEMVEEQTGFKTCNIAVTNAVLSVTGNLTLDHFLARNHRPRILLVQLSPNDFQQESQAWHQTIYAEGLLELLRHGRPGEARHILLNHPAEAVSFAGYAAGFTAWYGIKDIWFRVTSLRPEEDTVTMRNGFFTPPSPARTTCVAATSVLPSPNPQQIAFSRSLVADYRDRYADRTGIVLVNVAPIPDCDENLAAYSAQLSGITSNSLLPMPIGYFNNCCHYTARGSEIVSALVADELNTVANHNPNPMIDGRNPPTRQIAGLRRVRLRR
jgi:hypothetical protein